MLISPALGSAKPKGRLASTIRSAVILLASQDASRGLKVLGEVFGRNLREYPERLAHRIPDPPTVDKPMGTAILLRGGGSWIDDGTYEGLEAKLANQAALKIIRYSYNGPKYGCYTLWDNFQILRYFRANLDRLVEYLGEYIARIKRDPAMADKPIYVLGHSAGGLIAAHFLLRADNHKLIDRICFFATPFNPILPVIPVAFPTKDDHMTVRIPAPLDTKALAERCTNAMIVRCEADRVFRKPEETSLELNVDSERVRPLNEKVFGDKLDHFSVCGDDQVIEDVVRFLAVNL